MKDYIQDCLAMDIPISQKHFEHDIQDFVYKKRIENPFNLGIPGKNF